MTGFDSLREQMEGQKDPALKQTVDYLLTRDDLQENYLNPEKTIKEMAKFIRKKGIGTYQNGWNYVPDEVVVTWAVMYYTLPNKLLKIDTDTNKNENKTNTSNKNNVISLEEAKNKTDNKKEVEQISLFGGEV